MLTVPPWFAPQTDDFSVFYWVFLGFFFIFFNKSANVPRNEGRFKLDRRKKFFPMRAVRHCIRLPREAVDAPSLAVFKPLGWGFEHPGLVEGVPAYGRGVGTGWSIRSLATQTVP